MTCMIDEIFNLHLMHENLDINYLSMTHDGHAKLWNTMTI